MRNLSIIITHYRTPQLLRTLLKNLSRDKTSEKVHEIIVTDSNALESVESFMQKEFPTVVYKPFSTNAGYAKLVNAGIEKAKGSYLLILNADVGIGKEGIKKMLEFLTSKGDAAAVGVTDCFRFPTFRSLLARRTLFGKTRWGKKALLRYEMRDYKRDTPRAVDWVRGDCWMMKRSAVNEIGLLDEHFFMYFEDTDWCRRANARGYRIYFLPGIETIQKKSGASRQHGLKGLSYRFIHLISFIRYRLSWNR